MKLLKYNVALALIGACLSVTAHKHNKNEIDPYHYPVINSQSVALYETPWHLVEDLFITQPETSVRQAEFSTIKKGFMYIGAAVFANWALQKGFNMDGPLPAKFTTYRIAAAGNVGLLAYNGWQRPTLLREAERSVMEQVMLQWNELRSYFPETLRPVFDALYEIGETEGAEYDENFDKVIDIAKAEVSTHLQNSWYITIKRFGVRNTHRIASIAVPAILKWLTMNSGNDGDQGGGGYRQVESGASRSVYGNTYGGQYKY